MARFDRSELGSCSFLDVLEDAALRRCRVVLEMADGREIEDVVLDVVTEHGADWIALERHARVDVDTVVRMSRVDRPRST